MSGPIQCIWTGEVFKPTSDRFRRAADDRFGAGEVVTLDQIQSRSQASHGHYFAVLHEAWASLPGELAARFPTEDSLRVYALCKAGYCDVETFVAASEAEAQRLSAFVNKGNVMVTVKGATVTRLTPHSQSMKAMGAKAFNESKAAVLDVVADLIGVQTDDLRSAA